MELAIGSIMKEIFSSYSNTYPFNYLFGDKELLAMQVGCDPIQGPSIGSGSAAFSLPTPQSRHVNTFCIPSTIRELLDALDLLVPLG